MVRAARLLTAVAVSVLLAGCAGKHRLAEPQFCEEYRDPGQFAQQIELPCLHQEPAPDPRLFDRPVLSPRDADEYETRDISLAEAIQMAVASSDIVRQLPQTAKPPAGGAAVAQLDDSLLDQTAFLNSAYDVAVQTTQASGPGQGIEAALSEFDTSFSVSTFWNRREEPTNVTQPAEQIFASNFRQNTADMRAELAKTAATGTRLFARHNVLYDRNNNPTRVVPSDYLTNFELGFTQPLLRGAGADYNRIAGTTGQPGFYNGVLIARINTDISLTEFEAAVRDLVGQVIDTYWELYVAYRAFEAARNGRDNALKSWRLVQARVRVGVQEAAREAQARAEYHRFQTDMDNGFCDVLRVESRLRYLLALPVGDGNILRPAEEPIQAQMVFAWEQIESEALLRTAELRRQKWRIRQRELELMASRNLLLPRLDLTALYRFTGRGDHLLDPNGRGVPPFPGSNAWSTLADGQYQGWQIGFQFDVPLGFRREISAVRNAELQLARERARLRNQELVVSHLLAEAVRDLECSYVVAQSRYNNWIAAQDEADLVSAAYQANRITFDQVLNAIARLSLAETDFYRAVANYSRSIADVHRRKGSLLEQYGIYLAEGPSPVKAVRDAWELAQRRHRPLTDYCVPGPLLVSHGVAPQIQQPADSPVVGPSPGPDPPIESLPAPTEVR
jgi:outer membrane protein TolC